MSETFGDGLDCAPHVCRVRVATLDDLQRQRVRGEEDVDCGPRFHSVALGALDGFVHGAAQQRGVSGVVGPIPDLVCERRPAQASERVTYLIKTSPRRRRGELREEREHYEACSAPLFQLAERALD